MKETKVRAGEEQDLSSIEIGKDFTMEDFDIINVNSSRKQKEQAKLLLVDLKNRILEIQFENLEDQNKLGNLEKQLKEHPVMKARAVLKKNIGKKKKVIGELMSAYTGAMNMTKVVGVKFDSKTLKELRELTR